MAENQKDPYQYERALRQQAQKAFADAARQVRQDQPPKAGPAAPQQAAGEDAGGSVQELADSIRDLGRTLAREVSGALNSAAQSGAKQAGQAAGAAVRQAANVSGGIHDGLCIFGGTLAVLGAVGCGVLAMAAVFALTVWFDTPVFVTLIFLLAGLAGCAVLARWCFARPARRSRLRRYLAAMGQERKIPAARLAEAVQRPAAFVEKDIRWMIRAGWLADAFWDNEEGMFFCSAAEYRALQRRQEAAARAEREPAAAAELEDLLQQCDDFDLLLAEHVRSTAGRPELSTQIETLRRSAADIRDWVKAHPGGAGRVRKFARYYMPTTLKLLRAYADVQGQSSATAENIRREIDGVLATLNTAFARLRDDLLSDTALDISSEISAMQTMLAQDGLAEFSAPQ